MGSKLNKAVNAGLIAIVVLIVLFEAYAVIVPEAQAASTSMGDETRCAATVNTTGVACFWDARADNCWESNANVTECTGTYQIPLSSLFNATGVVYIIVMIGLLLLAIRGFMPKGKK